MEPIKTVKTHATINYVDGSKTNHTFSDYPKGAYELNEIGKGRMEFIRFADDEKTIMVRTDFIKSVVIRKEQIEETTIKNSFNIDDIARELAYRARLQLK